MLNDNSTLIIFRTERAVNINFIPTFLRKFMRRTPIHIWQYFFEFCMDSILEGVNKLFLRCLVKRFEIVQICRFNCRYNFDDFFKNHRHTSHLFRPGRFMFVPYTIYVNYVCVAGWSCGSGGAANGGYANVLAAGQFLQRSALRAASGGLCLLYRRTRRPRRRGARPYPHPQRRGQEPRQGPRAADGPTPGTPSSAARC
jgi:hypothetical protein